MATLAISNTETLANIGLMLGVGRDNTQWDTEVTADVNRIIRSGRRKFFAANQWLFLQQPLTIVTEAPRVVTGKIINGVLTIPGQLPIDPVDNYKVIPTTTGGIYDVASVAVPGNDITLDDVTVNTVAASETITLYRYRFPLPTNFASFGSPVVVENWMDINQLREYNTIPYFEALGILNRNTVITGPPEIFSVNSSISNANQDTGIFTYYFYAFPLIDKKYVIKTLINIQPGDALAAGSDTISPLFSELMTEAILSSAEIMYLRTPGVHTAMFNQLLPAAIKRDKEQDGVRRLLPRRQQHKFNNAQIRSANIDISGAIT